MRRASALLEAQHPQSATQVFAALCAEGLARPTASERRMITGLLHAAVNAGMMPPGWLTE